MTGAVQELLATFDSLTEAEKHDAAVQVLRRVVEGESDDIPEDALVAAAPTDQLAEVEVAVRGWLGL